MFSMTYQMPMQSRSFCHSISEPQTRCRPSMVASTPVSLGTFHAGPRSTSRLPVQALRLAWLRRTISATWTVLTSIPRRFISSSVSSSWRSSSAISMSTTAASGSSRSGASEIGSGASTTGLSPIMSQPISRTTSASVFGIFIFMRVSPSTGRVVTRSPRGDLGRQHPVCRQTLTHRPRPVQPSKGQPVAHNREPPGER